MFDFKLFCLLFKTTLRYLHTYKFYTFKFHNFMFRYMYTLKKGYYKLNNLFPHLYSYHVCVGDLRFTLLANFKYAIQCCQLWSARRALALQTHSSCITGTGYPCLSKDTLTNTFSCPSSTAPGKHHFTLHFYVFDYF